MLKNLQKNLMLICKRRKSEDIFDIILYGSAVKGKSAPRDVDLMVIFFETILKERLSIIQKLKFEIRKKLELEVDIKSMNLRDFLDKSNLARTGIILEGISLIDLNPLCSKLGFRAYTLFNYSLKGLTHTQKISFNYALKGRNSRGVLKELDGEMIGLAAAKIPIINSLIFEEFLVNKKVGYSKFDFLTLI